jgi:hypothetical protein
MSAVYPSSCVVSIEIRDSDEWISTSWARDLPIHVFSNIYSRLSIIYFTPQALRHNIDWIFITNTHAMEIFQQIEWTGRTWVVRDNTESSHPICMIQSRSADSIIIIWRNGSSNVWKFLIVRIQVQMLPGTWQYSMHWKMNIFRVIIRIAFLLILLVS